MSTDINPSDVGDDQTITAVASAKPQRSWAQPWVTGLAVVACLAVFVGLASMNDSQNWETLAKFGCLPANLIWDGAVWALVTSVFVHIEIWHVAFNVYWLWVLGSRLEKEIGSLPYLAFLVVAAFVSSAIQMAASDTTGIGMSGVAYAIFGFMWVTRGRYPAFLEVLSTQTIQLFLVWLMGCVIATHLKIWTVGNAAHISGLMFGVGVGSLFVLRYKPRLTFAALATLIACAIIPLVWCPWSVTWLSMQAYNAHFAHRYDDALVWYSKVINIDPRNVWAFVNRSGVYTAIGRIHDAKSDMDMARKLDPEILSKLETK